MHNRLPFLLLVITAGQVLSIRIKSFELWNSFKEKYEKIYTKEQEKMRFSIFEENLEFIVRHNLQVERGLHSYSLGITSMADMAYNEYLNRFASGTIDDAERAPDYTKDCEPKEDIPESIDYRSRGMVTPVEVEDKAQDSYAYASKYAIETAWKKKTGELVSLSAQQILECSKDGISGECLYEPFNYVMNSGGLESASSYPHKIGKGLCRFNKKKIKVFITGCVRVPDEETLEKAVGGVGAVVVGLDVSLRTFQHYKSGIYNDSACEQEVNGGLTVVGYTEDSWILKNNFGKHWGENGYIRLAKNKGMCCIACRAEYPTVV